MDEKKLREMLNGGDVKQLAVAYLKLMDEKPSFKQRVQLDSIHLVLGREQTAQLTAAWYDRRAAHFDERRFRSLTGYGQCQGALIARGNDVIVCCCRKMAGVIAYGHAHYFGGRIYVPGKPADPCENGGATYIIDKTRGISFVRCPFCGAEIIEHLVKPSTDQSVMPAAKESRAGTGKE